VKPELVAEVEFQQWTPDGMLRAPVFLRLREDVDPKAVRRTDPRVAARPVAEAAASTGDSEIDAVLRQLDNRKAALTIAVGKHTLKLTHLDRVYWPADTALKQSAITKRDLLRYFAQVSPYMLTHLADRPLTMIRMPEGIGGERFFQKHWDPELPAFAKKITVFSEHKDERQRLPAVRQPADAAVARAGPGRSSSTCGTRARSPAPTPRRRARTSASPCRRSRPRSSTTPTSWCSTSTPTSTRARRRRAGNPS